jgi:molybdopterin molybdotransferase
VPAGADAVERIEVIRVIEDGGERWIELSAEVARGRNITPRGLEARCGDEVVSAGVRVTPGVAAVLATFGCQQVTAASRPRLALLSTGSELVPVDSQPVAGQIRDSNSFSLAGYAREAGAEIVSSEIVPDDFDQTVRAIDRALGAAEVVILSGGVSMGDYDLVKPALSHLGAEIIFDRVAMHPGKPTVLAKRGDQLIFGLPGNPVSVAVAFFLFVRPALLKMQGALQVELPRATLFCAGNVKGAPPRRSHQPGRLRIVEGRAEIEPLRWSGSGDLIGFMRADSLLVIPEDRAAVATGDLVEAILLP